MNLKKRKIINLFLIVLLVLDIPFILYSFNFNYFAFNGDFHKKEFRKYDGYNKLKNYDIEKINNDVLDYLKNKNVELIDNDFFNEREKTHLEDVKDLVQFFLFLFYFSIVLFFILLFLIAILNKKIIKNLGIVFFFSGILTFLDAFIFWIMVKLNFNFVFDLIHKTFFKPGTYVFDPSFENIVNLYTQGFFYDVTVNIVINTLIFSLVLVLVGLFVIYFNKKYKKKTKKYLNKPK